MTFVPDDISLSSNQNTNQFLVQVRIESQISYSIIKDFISWTVWKPPIASINLDEMQKYCDK